MWDFLPPTDAKNSLERANMECIKCLDMSPIRGPSFAAIQQHRDTNSLVDSHLGGYSKVVVDENSVQQSAEGRGGSFDTVLNFAVQAAVISQNTA